MSSVSPDTSRVCFSSRRYSGVISEVDSMRSPFVSSFSKVGLALAIRSVASMGRGHRDSVTIVHDRVAFCNIEVEALGRLPEGGVVLEERGACGRAHPAGRQQGVGQVRVAEREAAELVREQEAPLE